MDLLTYQKALYDAYKALGYDVYDYVPTDAPMPYIRLDFNQTLDAGTKTTEGYEILQYINIFSIYKGQKEVKDIAQKLLQLSREIDGLDVRLRQLTIREENYKQEKVNGTTMGSIYQATLVLKIKI